MNLGGYMKKNKKRSLEDFAMNISSKIKEIFIEIHDYNFFHSPSEPDNIDRRFIGRDRLITRMKRILTHEKSVSGAYLITGYRGVGKSSFINKVFSKIYPKPNLVNKYNYIAVCIISFSLLFIDKTNYFSKLIQLIHLDCIIRHIVYGKYILSGILIILLTLFLYLRSREKNNLKISDKSNIVRILISNLFISRNDIPIFKMKRLIQTFYISLLIY